MLRSVGLPVASLLLGVLGCSGERDVFVEAAWPADHTVVVHVVDNDGAPLASPAIYGPGVAVRPALNQFEPFQIFVRTYGPERLAPHGGPFTTCRIGVGVGTGTPLPTPSSAWRTGLVDPADDDVPTFVEQDLENLAALDLHLVGCPPSNVECDAYTVEQFELPEDRYALGIDVLDDDRAMVIAQAGLDTNTYTHTYLEVDRGGAFTPLPDDPTRPERIRNFTWDHANTYYFVTRRDRLLHAMGLDGSPRPVPDGVVVDQMTAGVDGTVLGFDQERTVELNGANAPIPRPDVPFGLEGMQILRRDRIIARTQKTIYSFDGNVWTEEHEVAVLEEVSDVIISDEMQALVGLQELARVRDDRTGAWIKLPRPFDKGLHFDRAAPLSGGRFVAAGERGVFAVWTGNRWCDLSLDSEIKIYDVDVAQPGTVAWAAATPDVATTSFAIRLTAPPAR